MDSENKHFSPSNQSGRVTDRLILYQQQLIPQSRETTLKPTTTSTSTSTPKKPTTMSRDPITCHVLNTLTGTPAANLPVTLTLLSSPASPSTTDADVSQTNRSPSFAFQATTDQDGRVKNWTPAESSSLSSPPTSVPEILSSLPTADSKTNWSVRFAVGPWYEEQGVESFWPEVEVKFTVKGRGREGEEGWRHYHVPVLLGPWSYSTYRGS